MRYSTLLFDLDHTLLDSDASEVAAFADTVRSIGHEPSPALFDSYREINRSLWDAVERGETTPDELRVTRFERFVDAAQLSAGHGSPVDAEAMADTFTTGLGNHGELYPGARRLLERLAERATLAMVTNGLSEVQRARIDRLGLAPYFDAVVISAEVGASKPGTQIYDLTFAKLGIAPSQDCLMIGDSLTSDIQGGTNYGLDTCWYNPNGKSSEAVPTAVVTHEISALDQLGSVVVDGATVAPD